MTKNLLLFIIIIWLFINIVLPIIITRIDVPKFKNIKLGVLSLNVRVIIGIIITLLVILKPSLIYSDIIPLLFTLNLLTDLIAVIFVFGKNN